MDHDAAANYVNNAAQALAEYKRSPQGRSASAGAYQGRMIRGGIICLIGLAVTIGSMMMAADGGRYVLAWGAVIFGGFDFIIGFFGWLSNR